MIVKTNPYCLDALAEQLNTWAQQGYALVHLKSRSMVLEKSETLYRYAVYFVGHWSVNQQKTFARACLAAGGSLLAQSITSYTWLSFPGKSQYWLTDIGDEEKLDHGLCNLLVTAIPEKIQWEPDSVNALADLKAYESFLKGLQGRSIFRLVVSLLLLVYGIYRVMHGRHWIIILLILVIALGTILQLWQLVTTLRHIKKSDD